MAVNMGSEKHVPPSKKTLAEGGGVLIMGLPRSGTFSVAHAMKVLGHDRVFHNLDVPLKDNKTWGDWFGAMWACKPFLREHVGLPYFAKKDHPPTSFTRADWDKLLGNEHQVIADMSVYFVRELIEAYPNAQVILWQREYDSWIKSYDSGVLRGFDFHSSTAMFIRRYIAPYSRVYWHMTMWYGVAGWLGAQDYENMRANARGVYDKHFEMVRTLVKPGNLLEFKLTDGWEPVCKFLDCPIPNEPFPHLNEMTAINDLGKKMNTDVLYLALWNLAKPPLAIGITALAVWAGYQQVTRGGVKLNLSSWF